MNATARNTECHMHSQIQAQKKTGGAAGRGRAEGPDPPIRCAAAPVGVAWGVGCSAGALVRSRQPRSLAPACRSAAPLSTSGRAGRCLSSHCASVLYTSGPPEGVSPGPPPPCRIASKPAAVSAPPPENSGLVLVWVWGVVRPRRVSPTVSQTRRLDGTPATQQPPPPDWRPVQ